MVVDDWGIDEPQHEAGDRDPRVARAAREGRARRAGAAGARPRRRRHLEVVPQPRLRVQIVLPEELNAYDVLVNDWLVFSTPSTLAAVPVDAGHAERDMDAGRTPATSSSGRSCPRSRTPPTTRTSTRSSSPTTPTRSRSSSAIEEIFGVKVTNVNTLNRKGKRKRNRRTGGWGKRSDQRGPSSRSPRATDRDLRELTMAVRKRKPTSPGRRFQSSSDFAEITRDKPEQSLTNPKKRSSGRNVYGRMTSRHRGGGHKQKYRVVDFRRDKDGVPAKVAAIEYDPNRNARIALLHYLDGEKRYILAPVGVAVDDRAPERPGLRDPSRQRAAAALHPGRHHGPQRRAQAGRGRQAGPRRGRGDPAGRQGGRVRDAAPAVDRDAAGPDRLPGDRRQVGNAEAALVSIGKAGRNRWRGKRPHTRASR